MKREQIKLRRLIDVVQYRRYFSYFFIFYISVGGGDQERVPAFVNSVKIIYC